MKLKGNKKLKLIIENMLKSGRFPHALLIEGERGLGKHTLAMELANILLCEENDSSPCGNCRGCQLFKAKTHPDFQIISPTDKNLISIKAIRKMRDDAYIRPARNGRKVYIIEAEGGLKADCQNALLKVLEEPPEYVVFIIIALAAEQFLDTIISRCVDFKLLAPSESEALEVMTEKLPDAPLDQLLSALSVNDNNIGRALDLLCGNTGEVSADASRLLSCAALKKGYEALRLLSKYERDPKGFSLLLSLTEALIDIDLRNTLSSGTLSNLSRDELIGIKKHIAKTRELSKHYVSGNLLTTTFCAGLFK